MPPIPLLAYEYLHSLPAPIDPWHPYTLIPLMAIYTPYQPQYTPDTPTPLIPLTAPTLPTPPRRPPMPLMLPIPLLALSTYTPCQPPNTPLTPPTPPRRSLMSHHATYTPSGLWIPTLPASPKYIPDTLHPLIPLKAHNTPHPLGDPQCPIMPPIPLLAYEYLHSLPVGKFNLTHIWDRVLTNTPGLKLNK